MKKYKKVYIYRESKFPDDGWIQPCFKCYAPTSGQYELDTVKTNTAFYEIHVYVCQNCQEVFEDNDEEYDNFLDRCAKYIEKYIIFR